MQLGILAVLGALVGWKLTSDPASPPADMAAAAAVPAAAAALPAPSVAAPAAPEALPASEPEPEPVELTRGEEPGPPELDPATRERWRQRVEREQVADARFQEGLAESRVRSRDIDARLRAALERVELEPELVDGGRMAGLRIRAIEGGSVLAEAGFRTGDLLVSLDGQPLDDPFELPRLLASAGPEISLCAAAAGSELCRDLLLR